MFNLEKHERSIIIFLILTFLLGLSIMIYRKSHPNIKIDIKTSTINLEQASPKININEAGADELMKIRGVGKVLAGRIIEYRSQKGLFLTTEDIKNVKGVGQALFDKIKNRISVE